MRLRRRQPQTPAGAFGPPDDGPSLQLPVPKLGGWMLAERGYGRVEVRVGEHGPVRARLFTLPQDELARLTPEPSAPMAGWVALPELSQLEPGTEVEVTATARGPAGSLELGSAMLTAAARPADPPVDPGWVETLSARTAGAAAGHTPGSGLRLLAFTHHLGLGGGQLYLAELVEHLVADQTVACTVVAPEDGPLRKRLERSGAAVHLAPRPADADAYESQLRMLIDLAGETEANAVFANTALCFNGIDLAARLGIPSAWAIHESQSFTELLYGASFRWADDHVASRMHAALETASIVLFEAEATRRLYAAQTSAPERLLHLDYGIELGEIEAARSELDRERLRAERGLRPDDRVILCPGNIEPRKAQLSLALAFARVSAEFPDAVLALVGKGQVFPDYAAGAERVVGRLGLPEDRLRIEGITPQIYEWFASADAIAIASDNESLPRVILEAMAFGLPVLATRVFGIPELIEDGANGLLCEPADLDSLTDGVRRLVSIEPGDAAELGRAGFEAVRTRDAARYAASVRSIFERLLEGAGTPLRG